MEDISLALKNAIKDLYGLDFEPEITPAPDNIDADYSTNAPMKLAKFLHKPPMEIGGELEDKLTRVTSSEGDPQNVLRSKNFGGGEDGRTRVNMSAPGFLNFTLSDDLLANKISALSKSFDENTKSDKYEGKTIICEFSDPNPFKVLHVGHLYTSVVGDAISRLYEYAGANVIRANFGGDVGLHVAKTMYALLKKDINNLTIEDIAKCYIEGTAAYENDENAKTEITKLNKEIYKINAENLHNSPLAELYWRGRELSYEYFKDFYAHIGVKFDKFYPESTVANLGLKTVQTQLENGVYELSDGAIVFDGDKFGLHTRVFINREGVPTYEAKDVGLIFTKWEDYHFDKSVVITGNEQSDYMKVVLKSVEQYAPELVAKTTHLTHGLVKLPGNIKMSSRKGNFLKAVDVLDMVKDELKNEYNSTDETVSLAATKYAFLKYKMGGDIIFDPKESVKMTGNSGPYLLYSAVRAKKILSKVYSVDSSIREWHLEDRPQVTTEEEAPEPRDDGREGRRVRETPFRIEERSLAKKLLEYKGVLATAVTEMAPHKVATYLYELAQEFSRFYEHCPVAGSDNEAARAELVQVFLSTITHGLHILGINIPEEM